MTTNKEKNTIKMAGELDKSFHSTPALNKKMCNHYWQIIIKEYVPKWGYWLITLKCIYCGDIKQIELKGQSIDKELK